MVSHPIISALSGSSPDAYVPILHELYETNCILLYMTPSNDNNTIPVYILCRHALSWHVEHVASSFSSSLLHW